uniref:Uncharacterized protein n=1 Tax=Arundo donax TaxID=35708 RepID=A0A0A9HG76_ARUDO
MSNICSRVLLCLHEFNFCYAELGLICDLLCCRESIGLSSDAQI